MGRTPCCDKENVKRGPWSPEEDAALKSYLQSHGSDGTASNWIHLPKKAGLRRCGKSCRLRWLNYLRPDIKHVIASYMPGRTDNDVKNYWNTKLKKKLLGGKIKNISSKEPTIANNANFWNPRSRETPRLCLFDVRTPSSIHIADAI
ncbi:hypothetical protein ACFXTO_043842 [Malus domestica]